jgi:cell division protein FtsB
MSKDNPSRQAEERATGLRGFFERVYEQRRRCATVAAAALTLGVGYHVVFGQNGLTVYQQKRQEAHALDQQLQVLTEENDHLKGHVERLQSDPGSIEHQAREELHYTRPGEVIVTLPNEIPAKGFKQTESKQ